MYGKLFSSPQQYYQLCIFMPLVFLTQSFHFSWPKQNLAIQGMFNWTFSHLAG
jgi:hypothetical protein